MHKTIYIVVSVTYDRAEETYTTFSQAKALRVARWFNFLNQEKEISFKVVSR